MTDNNRHASFTSYSCGVAHTCYFVALFAEFEAELKTGSESLKALVIASDLE